MASRPDGMVADRCFSRGSGSQVRGCEGACGIQESGAMPSRQYAIIFLRLPPYFFTRLEKKGRVGFMMMLQQRRWRGGDIALMGDEGVREIAMIAGRRRFSSPLPGCECGLRCFEG